MPEWGFQSVNLKFREYLPIAQAPTWPWTSQMVDASTKSPRGRCRVIERPWWFKTKSQLQWRIFTAGISACLWLLTHTHPVNPPSEPSLSNQAGRHGGALIAQASFLSSTATAQCPIQQSLQPRTFLFRKSWSFGSFSPTTTWAAIYDCSQWICWKWTECPRRKQDILSCHWPDGSQLERDCTFGVEQEARAIRRLGFDLVAFFWCVSMSSLHVFALAYLGSAGIMPALLQEIVSVYPLLSPPNLTAHVSNRVCNALALLQCVASHTETRQLFLNGWYIVLSSDFNSRSSFCFYSSHPSFPLSFSKYDI